jgi:aspartate--ammonia ligase
LFTETGEGKRGLNGDIVVWDYTRGKSLELSSMGIRVDKHSLPFQLQHHNAMNRSHLEYHKGVVEETYPLTVGGGIGQSRLCQVLLQKAHIGEVQSSVWPETVEDAFKERGVVLL